MSLRKLYISPSMIGQMGVIEEISNEDLFIDSLNIPRINTYAITIDYLVQCGVDKFVTDSIKEYEDFFSTRHDKKLHEFLKEKTENISEKKTKDAYKSIEDIFQYYLPENYFMDEKFQGIWGLKSFLNELLIATNTGTSLFRKVNTITEDLIKAKELLPLELYNPIKYLISTISQDTVDLPHSKYNLDKEDIRRFEKVFREKTFSDYKLAHSTLDNVRTSKSKALANIQQKSINLYQKHNGLINIKRGILTTLSVTPKIVDATFGKIPGTVADLASKLLANIIDTERRIIIYDYGPLYNDIYYDRIIIPMKKKIQEEKAEKERNKLN